MRLAGWKLAYGVGHFLNDVCATVWFSYTLLFFQRVLCFPSHLAGAVVLTGQLADGVSTVVIGLMVDRESRSNCCHYGKRKLWHLMGSLFVTFTVAFIFGPCLGCSQYAKFDQLWFYLVFVVLFQFGWAAVQISHLSLIPIITESHAQRAELNALRYGFTVLANIVVYVVAWVVLGTAVVDPDSARNLNPSTMTPQPLPTTLSTLLPSTAASSAITTAGLPDDTISINMSTTSIGPSLNAIEGWLTSTEAWLESDSLLAANSTGHRSGGIGPEDAPRFRVIVLSTMALGVVASLVFHLFTKEPSPVTTTPSPPSPSPSSSTTVTTSAYQSDLQASAGEDAGEPDSASGGEPDVRTVPRLADKTPPGLAERKPPALDEGDPSAASREEDALLAVVGTAEPETILEWLSNTPFWVLSVMYMCVRLYVNLSMTYITLYLHDYLRAEKISLAVFPLVMYIGGFCGSVAVKAFNQHLNRRCWLALGALLGGCACLGILFGPVSSVLYTHGLAYLVALLLGTGGSIMLVTTLTVAADIIGSSTRGAFVYGALSFCDKLSNGLVVEFIQTAVACTTSDTAECGVLYRYVLVTTCGGCSLIVLFVLLVYRSPRLWLPSETAADTAPDGDAEVEEEVTVPGATPSESSSLLPSDSDRETSKHHYSSVNC